MSQLGQVPFRHFRIRWLNHISKWDDKGYCGSGWRVKGLGTIELKAFSKLEKFQCLRNQSEVPGYRLKFQNGIWKPLEAIRVILQINARMYLKANNGWEEPFGLTTRFKCTQRYHSKNPRKWIGMFSGMWAIYINLMVFRKWSLSYLA